MIKPFTRTRTTWLAYVLLALYAYFLNILGPITPFLHDEFNLSYTVSSLHFSAFAAGILVVGFTGHFVIERTGHWQALSIGAVGLGIGALLLVLGRSPVVTVGATFLMGVIGSLILAVVPAALSVEHGELRAVAISEANVLSSVVSAAAPFLVGWLAGLLVGWRLALLLAALLSILVSAVLFRTARPQGVQTQTRPPGSQLPLLFWFYWFILVLAVAIEFCMVFWSADYLETELSLARASAAQAVSLFLVGMIIGRYAASRVLRRQPAHKVVLVSSLLGLAGFLIYWLTADALIGLTGLAVTGLGVASLYPALLSMAIGAAYGRENQAGGRTTLASGVAILTLPLVLGRVADIAGLKPAFAIIAVLFLLMFLLMQVARKVGSQSRAPESSHVNSKRV